MISQDMIEEVKTRLVKTYNPLAIYIFGSYAWGTPDEESDLDLLVVVEHIDNVNNARHRALVEGYKALIGIGDLGKDIILLSKKEFDDQANNVTTLGYKVMSDGKQIYAKA